MAIPEEELRRFEERLRGITTRLRETLEYAEGLTHGVERLDTVMVKSRDTFAQAQRVVSKLNDSSLTQVQRLHQQIEELQRLDISYGETLKASQAFTRGIEQLEDAISREKTEAMKEFGGALLGTSKTTQQFGTALNSLTGQYDKVKSGAIRLGQAIEGGLGETLVAAAGPLAAGALVAAFALDALVKRISEAQGLAKTFGGTMFRSSTGVSTFTGIMVQNAALMAIHNVEAEQLGNVYNVLNHTYGLSATQATKFAGSLQDYVRQITPAIIQTMAYGRVTGLTDDQTGKLISTFGLLGEDLRKSDELFAMVATRAQQAGVNVSDMVHALTTLGSANIFAERSLGRTTGTLSGYARSIMTSNDSLLTGSNRAAIAAKAMNSVAEAAARMDLPQMMGFGAALDGITGTLDDAMRKVAKMPREAIFERAMKEITTRVQPGSQLVARTLMAQQFGIQDVNSALGVAVGDLREQKRSQANALREQETIRRTGGDLSRLSAMTANRLDDIFKLLTKISQAAVLAPGETLRGIFGGRGEAAGPAMMPSTRGAAPGMASSAAGGGY